MELTAIVLLVVGVTVGIRVIAGALDGDRVAAYLKERGCALVSRQWTPFGVGWIGEASSRTYRVVYDDPYGHRRTATVKTSLWTGVYFTDDVPVEPSP